MSEATVTTRTDDPAATPDREALRRKYRLERDKRLRSDGKDQYLSLDGHLPDAAGDPFVARTERAALADHHTVICVGGGFAGLITAARLHEAGVTDVRIVEQGGDVGGTWYWNRYPGAQCDTDSMVYMPLLEETGHMPTEKYAHGPEIREHCRRIACTYDLYDDALFHTRVTDVAFDEASARWTIRTDRGDALTAQFVVLGIGPLSVPKLPGIPGIDSFRGHAFHTSRWDYAYTGGDPENPDAPMNRLSDKRVAIIGTGATAVQCVPHLARAAGALYVVQRTPSSVDVRDNHPTDPDWYTRMTAQPGWQQRWMENFTANQTRTPAGEDLVMDGWTDIAHRLAAAVESLPAQERTPETLRCVVEDTDSAKMNEIRARVDAIVDDHDTAQHLKAWYSQLCKRPCFHDEYLQAYNTLTVTLLDTDGQGVQKITENGLVVAGCEYPVDAIVFASGFEVGTGFTHRSGYEVTGRDGVRLSQYWADGLRSLHGMHVHGFPNAFVVQPNQGANLLSNIPHNITESAATIAAVVAHARAGEFEQVEVTAEAEQTWIQRLLNKPGRSLGDPECTPGYYNNEGHPHDRRALQGGGDPDGPMAFFHNLQHWRADGGFAGLTFR